MKKHFPFHEASTTLIPKLDKAYKRKKEKEKQLQISILMDTKTPNQTLAHQIQKDEKGIVDQDQVESILGMQGWFNVWKSIKVTHPINRLKEKQHMIISTTTEKKFEKIFNIDS